MGMGIEWGVGALFVLLHSFERYNTPATNRCTTTFAQFFVYGLLYCVAMMLIYLFLAAVLDSSPQNIAIVKQFFDITGQGGFLDGIDFVNQSKPFISALLVITILPNAPWLKTFDKWLLQVFWDFGRIPDYVTQQAESLRQAGYIIDPGKLRDLEIYATKYGINVNELSLEDRETQDFSWAKMASLQLSLDQWRRSANGRTRRFISDNEREYSLVKNLVDDLSFRFANWHSAKSARVGSNAALEKDITTTYKRLIEFIAKILLISERNQSDLQRRIRELGFGDLDFQARSLSANQMVLILACLFASFLVLSFLFDRVLISVLYSGENFNSQDYDGPRPLCMSKVLSQSLLMMMIYGAAMSCALLVKNKSVFSYNELTSQRPWSGYVLSGLLAVCTWAIVAWSYRYIELMLTSAPSNVAPPGTVENVGIVVTIGARVLDQLEWSYPYMLQSFVIAVGLSFLVDRRVPSDKSQVSKMMIMDTVILTVSMMFISLVVYQWMYGIFLFNNLETKTIEIKPHDIVWWAQLTFVLKHGCVGAIIGLLVPNWYRTNQSSGSFDSVARMIAMNKEELNNEARKLKSGALLQAFTSISLWVGNFKDQFDRNELEVFEVTMTQLSGLNSADFSIEEAHNFLSANRGNVNKQFLDESLGAIKSAEKIQTLCCWYALSMAYADRIYTEQEEEKVLEIFSLLPSVNELYMNNVSEFGRSSIIDITPESRTPA